MTGKLLACLLVVVALPMAAADPSSQGDKGGADTTPPSPGDHGKHLAKGHAKQEDNTTTLEVTVESTKAVLDWTFNGAPDKVREFAVLRSVDGGAADVIATVTGDTTHFEDPDLQTNTATQYSVQPAFKDGSSGDPSNGQVVFMGTLPGSDCPIVSVAPGAKPPVLFHTECLN
jgi:hypothetical protein